MDYEKFCILLNRLFSVRPLKDHKKKVRNKNVLLLRHDVDADFNKAMNMARIESKLGMSSTYFILHTAPYYNELMFISKCRHLQNLGHEVGIHNDVMSVRLQNKGNPKKIFDRVLERMRKHDIEIHGTSAHGSKICKRHGTNNKFLFSEYCKKNKINGIKTGTISLKQYNMYGAYDINHDIYVTDTGGEWKSGGEKIKNMTAYMDNLNASYDGIKIQLLTHPCRWDL